MWLASISHELFECQGLFIPSPPLPQGESFVLVPAFSRGEGPRSRPPECTQERSRAKLLGQQRCKQTTDEPAQTGSPTPSSGPPWRPGGLQGVLFGSAFPLVLLFKDSEYVTMTQHCHSCSKDAATRETPWSLSSKQDESHPAGSEPCLWAAPDSRGFLQARGGNFLSTSVGGERPEEVRQQGGSVASRSAKSSLRVPCGIASCLFKGFRYLF